MRAREFAISFPRSSGVPDVGGMGMGRVVEQKLKKLTGERVRCPPPPARIDNPGNIVGESPKPLF
jgi:hypothetical protein